MVDEYTTNGGPYEVIDEQQYQEFLRYQQQQRQTAQAQVYQTVPQPYYQPPAMQPSLPVQPTPVYYQPAPVPSPAPVYYQPAPAQPQYYTPATMEASTPAMSPLLTTVAPKFIATALSAVANRVVDLWFGDEKAERDQMYEGLISKLESSNLRHIDDIQRDREAYIERVSRPAGRAFPSGVSSPVPRSPVEAAMKDAEDVKNKILTSILSLSEAKDKSRCGMCRATLDSVIETVKSNTREIIDATDKVVAMQALKASGQLERDKTWESLTPDEKEMVRQTVREIYGDDYYEKVYDETNGLFVPKALDPDAKMLPNKTISREGDDDGDEDEDVSDEARVKPVRSSGRASRRHRPSQA